jgi:hypothetical protein
MKGRGQSCEPNTSAGSGKGHVWIILIPSFDLDAYLVAEDMAYSQKRVIHKTRFSYLNFEIS